MSLRKREGSCMKRAHPANHGAQSRRSGVSRPKLLFAALSCRTSASQFVQRWPCETVGASAHAHLCRRHQCHGELSSPLFPRALDGGSLSRSTIVRNHEESRSQHTTNRSAAAAYAQNNASPYNDTRPSIGSCVHNSQCHRPDLVA